MTRTITSMTPAYWASSLELVQRVFTEHENAREGAAVRRLVEEIRAKRFYLPELELIMLDEGGQVIGYAMFSRFHLEGRYEDRLLLLSPVAVETALQRQHISKALLEYGFDKAAEMGFDAVLVEGNPANYRARGFTTSCEHGVYAGETLSKHLPARECLMIRELRPGGLADIHGAVDYGMYEALCADV